MVIRSDRGEAPRSALKASIEEHRIQQLESRYLHGDKIPFTSLEEIATSHRSDRIFNNGAAGVLKSFARSKGRLNANYTGAVYLPCLLSGGFDNPVPLEKLHRIAGAILNHYGVRKDKDPFGRQGLFEDRCRFNRHRDARGCLSEGTHTVNAN